MRKLLASERSKWIFIIGVVAIGVGFTAKNVISYPTDASLAAKAFPAGPVAPNKPIFIVMIIGNIEL